MSEFERQPEPRTPEPNYPVGAEILDGPRGGWPSLDGEPTDDYAKRFQAALDSFDE